MISFYNIVIEFIIVFIFLLEYNIYFKIEGVKNLFFLLVVLFYCDEFKLVKIK